MTMLVPRSAAAVLVLVILAGCGGDGGGEPTPTPSSTLVEMRQPGATEPSGARAAPARPVVPPAPAPKGGQASFHLSGLALLASSADARKEIGLTPDQVGRLAALDDEFAEAGMDRFRSADYVDGVLGVLDEDQLDRLTRIHVRMSGPGSLINPAVRDRLELSDAQRERIVEIIAERIGAMVRAGAEGRTPAERQAAEQEVVRLAAELSAALGAVLTPEQTAALEAYGRGD